MTEQGRPSLGQREAKWRFDVRLSKDSLSEWKISSALTQLSGLIFMPFFFCLKETLAPVPPRGHGQALPHQDTLRGVQHLQPGRCPPARPEEVPCVPGSQGSRGDPAAGTGQDGGDTTGPFLCDADRPGLVLQPSSEEQSWKRPPLAWETFFSSE